MRFFVLLLVFISTSTFGNKTDIKSLDFLLKAHISESILGYGIKKIFITPNVLSTNYNPTIGSFEDSIAEMTVMTNIPESVNVFMYDMNLHENKASCTLVDGSKSVYEGPQILMENDLGILTEITTTSPIKNLKLDEVYSGYQSDSKTINLKYRSISRDDMAQVKYCDGNIVFIAGLST